ncbi:MAG: hypothetical protein ABJN69_05345 [Hellea sp.]
MRKIVCLFLMSFGAACSAQAQIAAQDTPAENEPRKEASKPVKPEVKKDVQDGFDLENFFKKGEENARNGASCDKPSEPADPVA